MKILFALVIAAALILSGCYMPNGKMYIEEPAERYHDLLFREFDDFVTPHMVWSQL